MTITEVRKLKEYVESKGIKLTKDEAISATDYVVINGITFHEYKTARDLLENSL